MASEPQAASRPVTRYIAAYDTERAGDCLAACKRLRAVHEEFGFPATFFIVGKRLEEEGAEYRAVLGDVPEFEIASHTYSHIILRDHPFCGQTPDQETRRREVWLGKELVEQTFGRPCTGLRPGCGFHNALRGDPWLIETVAGAGYRYVSSLLWGPETTVPALLEKPFCYDGEGHPDLWELPGHGWHENLLKAHNLTVNVRRIIAWPSPFPLPPHGGEVLDHSCDRIHSMSAAWSVEPPGVSTTTGACASRITRIRSLGGI